MKIIAEIDQLLEDGKAQNITKIKVDEKNALCDYLYIVTGTSNRHVKSLASNIVKRFKELGMQHVPVEGGNDSNWLVIDLGDAIIHLFQQEAREKFRLEEIWQK